MTWDLTYALAEEIGDPDLFVGREQEMKRLMDWAEGTKRRHSKSMAILSRRKKGKTALLQRFFNILFTRNDPQLIPFYYRIPEKKQFELSFTESFYRRTLTQYFAFVHRKPEWVRKVLSIDALKELGAGDPDIADDILEMEDMMARAPSSAWIYAQEAAHRLSQAKDIRILQILDEFQYLNKFIYLTADSTEPELLCHSYMGAAESKFSPQIVAGSYIGWLEAILGHLTARYREWHLEGLTDAEALESVFNYAYNFEVPITSETASYIAEVCANDPFYIAATITNTPEEKDLTTEEGVREALAFETVTGQGEIARVWNEYLQDAFSRVNDINARKIVLYLAHHDPESRTRKQIREDLDLTMSEGDLEKRMHQLVYSDILAYGRSYFHYKGLGDRVFAMIFRRLYGAEVEQLDEPAMEAEFKRGLAALKGQLANTKGALAEHRVRYRLLLASLRGATLADVVHQAPTSDTPLGPFDRIRKARFHLDQERSVEIDLHAVHKEDGPDLMVEVKDWEGMPSREAIQRFVDIKTMLADQLERKKTIFLFYSENGLNDDGAAILADAGILLMDPKKLAAFEASNDQTSP